jgi:hypothetical protein
MKTRVLFILLVSLAFIAGLAVIVHVVRIGEELRKSNRSHSTPATPLAACQTVPANLPEDLRQWYNRICSATNTEERFDALHEFVRIRAASYPTLHPSPSEMAAFLPLLSELMTTGDYVEKEHRRIYECYGAAQIMAGAGVAAVPFAINALQSKRTLEIHAGLECAQDIVGFLEWRGWTNELPAVCISLHPYVTMHTTNNLPDPEREVWSFGDTITGAAKRIGPQLERYLPPTASVSSTDLK